MTTDTGMGVDNFKLQIEKQRRRRRNKKKKRHTGESPVRRMGKMPMPRTTAKEETNNEEEGETTEETTRGQDVRDTKTCSCTRQEHGTRFISKLCETLPIVAQFSEFFRNFPFGTGGENHKCIHYKEKQFSWPKFNARYRQVIRS